MKKATSYHRTILFVSQNLAGFSENNKAILGGCGSHFRKAVAAQPSSANDISAEDSSESGALALNFGNLEVYLPS